MERLKTEFSLILSKFSVLSHLELQRAGNNFTVVKIKGKGGSKSLPLLLYFVPKDNGCSKTLYIYVQILLF